MGGGGRLEETEEEMKSHAKSAGEGREGGGKRAEREGEHGREYRTEDQ